MRTKDFIMVLFGLAAIAGLSAIVMLLWNVLFTNIFGLASINFWQAGGLYIFAHILFGGVFRGKTRMAAGLNRNNEGGFGKNPIRERWQKMTSEERKEFINKLKERRRNLFDRDGLFGTGGFGFDANEEPKKENESVQ
ncbi:hypothetical protein EZS27_020453 [termite gut metagenome]|uniref:Uncharacterized protein n=1 Tax=termite gut metagenome TaxID=433724 RepID=A0A5J4RAB2_9ZZZZ